MCEILLLYFLGKQIAEMAGAKMRNGTLYVVMLVLLWFGGEVAGLLFGLVLIRGNEEKMILAYFCALLGAAAGAVLSFIIVGLLPHAYEDNDRPRRRRRRRPRYDDDEDEEDEDRRRRRRRRLDDGSFESKPGF